MAAASDIRKLELGNLVKITVGPNKRRLSTVETHVESLVRSSLGGMTFTGAVSMQIHIHNQ